MGKNSNVIDDFALLVDQHIRGIQYGIYTTALLGLGIALRSVRPFKKFTTPQSIPASFLRKHTPLHGKVVGVDPPGLLQVDHFPVIHVPRGPTPPLPVCIDSVQVMGHGTAWLQTVVSGQNIIFRPVTIEKDAVSCIITREKKNVGIQLVSLGMASVQPFHANMDGDKLYSRYYEDLLSAEERAQYEGAGMWADEQLRQKSTLMVQIAKKAFGALRGTVKNIRHLSASTAR